jgi:hypothetical protein
LPDWHLAILLGENLAQHPGRGRLKLKDGLIGLYLRQGIARRHAIVSLILGMTI